MEPIEEKGWLMLRGGTLEEGGEISDLAVIRGTDGAIYSLWRPSWAERILMLFGMPIAVGVLSQRQPPITVLVGRGLIPGLTI